jgi:hypothetical protein
LRVTNLLCSPNSLTSRLASRSHRIFEVPSRALLARRNNDEASPAQAYREVNHIRFERHGEGLNDTSTDEPGWDSARAHPYASTYPIAAFCEVGHRESSLLRQHMATLFRGQRRVKCCR